MGQARKSLAQDISSRPGGYPKRQYDRHNQCDEAACHGSRQPKCRAQGNTGNDMRWRPKQCGEDVC